MKITTKTIHEIDYNDLEQFAKEKLGLKDYEFPEVQECGNNWYYKFMVGGKLSEYDLEKLNCQKHYSNRAVLNKLCADGHIPPGEYLVSVSW